MLLILAGVTINTLTGDNGILNQATKAKESTDKGGIKEQLDLAVLTSRMGGNNAEIDTSVLSKELDKLEQDGVIDTYTEDTVGSVIPGTAKKGKYEFKIDENGGITWGDYVESKDENPTGETEENSGEIAEKLSETDTTETWSVGSFGNLNDDLDLPKTKNVKAVKGKNESIQQIVIPAGFIQAEDSSDKLEGGIVIEDDGANAKTKGNQFVWVPVNQKLKFANGTKGIIELGRYSFENRDIGEISGPKRGDELITLDETFSARGVGN